MLEKAEAHSPYAKAVKVRGNELFLWEKIMDKEVLKNLTCTRCGEVKETYSELEYSQGDLVCLDCKKETLDSDKRAFDRDMRLQTLEGL